AGPAPQRSGGGFRLFRGLMDRGVQTSWSAFGSAQGEEAGPASGTGSEADGPSGCVCSDGTSPSAASAAPSALSFDRDSDWHSHSRIRAAAIHSEVIAHLSVAPGDGADTAHRCRLQDSYMNAQLYARRPSATAMF